MAILFDTNTDVLGSLASPGVGWSTTSFTVCGFAQITSEVGSQVFTVGSVDGANESVGFSWAGTSSGTMYVYSNSSGGGAFSTAFGSRPATGVPFFWYLKCSGTGAGLLQAGWCLLDGTAFTTQSMTMTSGANGTTVSFALGGSIVNSLFGHMAGVRLYDRALSADELECERWSLYPMFLDTRAFWPLWDSATALVDYSGNGGTLDYFSGSGGTLPSDSTIGFPVRVRPRRSGRAIFAPSTGPATPGPWFAQARVVRRRGA